MSAASGNTEPDEYDHPPPPKLGRTSESRQRMFSLGSLRVCVAKHLQSMTCAASKAATMSRALHSGFAAHRFPILRKGRYRNSATAPAALPKPCMRGTVTYHAKSMYVQVLGKRGYTCAIKCVSGIVNPWLCLPVAHFPPSSGKMGSDDGLGLHPRWLRMLRLMIQRKRGTKCS